MSSGRSKNGKEQTHSKTKESLNEIINSDSVGESAKKEAVDKLAELADIMEKEAATEQLLASKGFENAVVLLEMTVWMLFLIMKNFLLQIARRLRIL